MELVCKPKEVAVCPHRSDLTSRPQTRDRTRQVRTLCHGLFYILYSWKIWWRIKFGSFKLAVYITTAKLKSAKISYSHIYDPVPNHQL